MNEFPFVSICTPTFNRRPFICLLIEMIKLQNYPMNRLEWVIVDDGTDSIKDIVDGINFIEVRYFQLSSKNGPLKLGEKRNLLNSKAKGEFIVYFDDDDYYPPNRIDYGINLLLKNKNYLIAGSSIMNIYYHKINKIYQSGPYGPYHATAATFIFNRKLLEQTSFSEESLVGEEKVFLKNYTIPLLQLDVNKTILVLAHAHNTFDKYLLLEKIELHKMKLTNYSIDELINQNYFINHYKSLLHKKLEVYKEGEPTNKPKVLEFITNRIQEKEELKSQIDKYEKSTTCNNQIKDYEDKLEKKTKIIQKLLNEMKGIKEELRLTKEELKLAKEKRNK